MRVGGEEWGRGNGEGGEEEVKDWKEGHWVVDEL